MDSYAALVDSPEVTRAVNEELRLGVDPEDIASVLSASVLSKTVVLKVTASGEEPAATASIANVAAERLGAVIQLVEAPGTGAASPLKVTVTRPANAPGTPTSPNVKLALALGLVGGLGAGLLAAALRDQAVLSRSVAPAHAIDDASSAPAEHAEPPAMPAAAEDAVAADHDQAIAPELVPTRAADASEAAATGEAATSAVPTGEALATTAAVVAAPMAAAPAPEQGGPTRSWWILRRGRARGGSAQEQHPPALEDAAAGGQAATLEDAATGGQAATLEDAATGGQAEADEQPLSGDQQVPDTHDVSDGQAGDERADERLVMAGFAPPASHAFELQPLPPGPTSSPVASLDQARHEPAAPGGSQEGTAAPRAVSPTDVDEDHAPSSA